MSEWRRFLKQKKVKKRPAKVVHPKRQGLLLTVLVVIIYGALLGGLAGATVQTAWDSDNAFVKHVRDDHVFYLIPTWGNLGAAGAVIGGLVGLAFAPYGKKRPAAFAYWFSSGWCILGLTVAFTVLGIRSSGLPAGLIASIVGALAGWVYGIVVGAIAAGIALAYVKAREGWEE